VKSFLKKNLLDAPPSLLFGLLAVAAWWRPVFLNRALFYDILFKLFGPNQEFLRRCVLSGIIPLWNPYIYSGAPFMANLQSAVFYPFSYVGLILDFPRTVAFNTVVHTALAGLFMHALGRALGLSKRAAAVAGIAFALNGGFLLRYAFPSHYHSYVWLPLILLPGYARDLKPWRASLIGGAGLALQTFAGHPQFLMYGLVAVAVCAAAAPDRARWVKVYAGAGAVFAVLAAVQLFALADFSVRSVRAAGFGFDWAMANSIRPSEMLVMFVAPQWNSYFIPKSGDPHIVGFYFGPAILLCAAAAFRLRRARWLPFAVMAALGILLGFGEHFFLYPFLFDHFAPLRSVRFPAQAFYLTAFGVSVLSGLGFEEIPARGRRWLPLLAVLDLLAFGWKGTILEDPAVYSTRPPMADWLARNAGQDRLLLTPNTRNHLWMNGRTETEAWLRFKNAMFPNFPTQYGFYAADGQEELRDARYEKVLDRVDRDPLSPWIDVIGIRHMLSFGALPPKFSLAESQNVSVFRNPAAFPKAYVAYSTVLVPDQNMPGYVETSGSRALLAAPAVVDPEIAVPACRGARAPLPVVEDGIRSVHVEAEGPCPGLLVLTDAYDPGWRARVNGVETPVRRVNYVQRGVLVPAGKISVDFEYRPAWFAPLLALSGLGWLASLVAFAAGARGTRPQPR
jgi:hypothetical protein